MAQPPNTLLTAVLGDTGDTRTLRIDGAVDLVAVTAVRAHVWKDGTDPVVLSASVADADDRTVTVQLGNWLATVAEPGVYWFELELDTSGSSLTWPSKRATLRVRDEGN